VAASDSKNEMSKAISGSRHQPTSSDPASARLGQAIRPNTRAAKIAASIQAARQAEPLPPAKSA
jgi:hypothetical protein